MNRFLVHSLASLRTLLSRALASFHATVSDADLEEEVRTHLNFAIEENIRHGMSPADARTAALLAFGPVTQIKESYRIRRSLPFLPILLQDLGFGLRQLRKSPGFAIVAIGSLALGIGASVAVFSVVRAVLLDPYPYKDADRMVHVEIHNKTPRVQLLAVTSTEYKELQEIPAIEDVFIMDDRTLALTGDNLPVSVEVGFYSSNLFTYMGVPPLLGRQWSPADALNGNASPVAVLSYLFWKKQYNADPGILGKSIEIDHVAYTVLGVSNPRFTWGDSEVYIPGNFKADPNHYMSAFIKVKPGVSHAALAAQLQPLVENFAKRDPGNFPQSPKVQIVTLNEEVLHGFGGALVILFSAVFMLLLIGCANVSILLLARGSAREHEFAVRSSIGASRGRILRQLLTESVLLSLIGAALGVLLAYRGVDLLAAYLPQNSFPHEATAAIHVNAAVLVFAVVTALVTGILFGISPALQLSRAEAGSLTQSNAARLAGTIRGRHTHRVLIAGQVALTMLLLATAGAALRAFMVLYHTPLGFNSSNLFFMSISQPKTNQMNWETLRNTEQSILQIAGSAPGVASACISTAWTPPVGGFRGKILISSRPDLTNAQSNLALVSPNIFSTLQVPLLAGRLFTMDEEARAAHVALVNRTFVKQYFPTAQVDSPVNSQSNGILNFQDVIGKAVRSPALKFENPNLRFADKSDDWFQIIGVVEDTRNDGLVRPIQPQLYMPSSFIVAQDQFLVIRATTSPVIAMRSVAQALHQYNPGIFVRNQHEIEWLLDNQEWGSERFLAFVFAVFAVLALSLAATGIYSVVSYTVSQRTREFGVRMALGAQRGSVIRLVLQSSLITVAIGAATGIILSLTLGKLIATSPHASLHDPAMLLTVCTVLLSVTVLACIFPAWRAASINPVQALRAGQ